MLKIQSEINYSDSDELISKALQCLEEKLRYKREDSLTNTKDVCAYVRLQLAREKDEVFAGLFLTNHLNLIAFEKLFYGSINQTVVYPRLVVKKALAHNTAKMIIAHNHPSQHCEPSLEDKQITKKLYEILDIVDVELIDHIIVTVTTFIRL